MECSCLSEKLNGNGHSLKEIVKNVKDHSFLNPFNIIMPNTSLTCFFQSVVNAANETAKKVRFKHLFGYNPNLTLHTIILFSSFTTSGSTYARRSFLDSILFGISCSINPLEIF